MYNDTIRHMRAECKRKFKFKVVFFCKDTIISIMGLEVRDNSVASMSGDIAQLGERRVRNA